MARMFFGWRVVAAAVAVFAYGNAVYGPGVWLHVFLAFGAGTAAQVGLFSHLFSMAAPALGPQAASWVMATVAVCALLGRTATGWFLKPHVDRRRAAAWTFLVQAGGNLTLLLSVAGLAPAAPVLLAGCVLFGIEIGNMLFLPLVAAQAEWPPSQVPAVVAAMLLGGAFSLLRDGLGDWAAAGAALALQLTAAPLVRGTASAKPATWNRRCGVDQR